MYGKLKILVTNTDNYKTSYTDEVPFEAELVRTESYGDINLYWVKNLESGKVYELYPWQLTELFDENNEKSC